MTTAITYTITGDRGPSPSPSSDTAIHIYHPTCSASSTRSTSPALGTQTNTMGNPGRLRLLETTSERRKSQRPASSSAELKHLIRKEDLQARAELAYARAGQPRAPHIQMYTKIAKRERKKDINTDPNPQSRKTCLSSSFGRSATPSSLRRFRRFSFCATWPRVVFEDLRFCAERASLGEMYSGLA